MKRLLLLTIVLVLFSCCALAASPDQKARYQQFNSLVEKDDLAAAEQLLRKWQEESPQDVELAVGWANFYLKKGLLPVSLYTGERNDHNVQTGSGGVYEVRKEGTTETAGFLDARPRFDDEMLTRALDILGDAVTTHPERVDIWMGKTHIQLIAEDYKGAFATLREFARYGQQNPDKLRFKLGAPLPKKAAKFMPETLHAYAIRGYETETTAGLEFMRKTGELAQELYPNHPYGYNDQAAYHNIMENDRKVIELLSKAYKLDPNDPIITMNLARAHSNLGQKDKAREFYKKSLDIADDEEMKADAQQELQAMDGGRRRP